MHARSRRRGRQEAELDRAIDDLERLEPSAAVRLVERNLVVDESARRRAVEQAAGRDRRLQRLLDRQAVEHRLQDRSAADHRLPRRPVLAGLVVGDAKQLVPSRRVVSIRSTEPRSLNRPSTRTGSGTLRGSRPSSPGRPKRTRSSAGCPVRRPIRGSRRTQTRRSRPMSAISSRQTRSIAGARLLLVLGGDGAERASSVASAVRDIGLASPAAGPPS